MQQKRLLTGDRPTGKLHLGHYVGSLQNRVKLQDKFESYIMVADVQALTDNFDNPQKVRDNVFEVVVDNLAVGVDPDKATFFIQSQIPQIAELTVFYSNLVTVSELQRNPTVKTEVADKGNIFKDGNVTFGFLGYPVSQAADITFLRAQCVPVGADQAPMIEQTRKLAKRFNNYYGDVFPLPEGIYGEVPRLVGLDGRKMSKSFGNAIYLSDSLEEIKSKVSKAKTDSDTDNLIRFDEKNKPDVSNLIKYYQIVSGLSIEKIEEKFVGITSYRDFKESLVSEIDKFLDPIRQRRSRYEQNPDLVWEVLEKGRQKVLFEAEKTMQMVRQGMKIDY